jgi:adenine-specific DNA-methyltransferase
MNFITIRFFYCNMEEFRESSKLFNETLSKEIRQENGIFFTPKTARDKLFEILNKNKIKPKTILEPSFGSGEFLDDLYKNYPKAEIHGVELNKQLYENYPNKKNLVNDNFLDYESKPVDLIVGNPPYFNVKDKNLECMTGHGNIYILFLYKCLTKHLKKNGVLAFVLPTSLYNSSYYEPCRKYIADNTTILAVEDLKVKYYETSQKTMILVIQNKPSKEKPFIFERSGNTYISPYYKELVELVDKTKTLEELGYKIKTGEVVWNQNKDLLSDKGDLIIYTTNIVDNKLVLNNLGTNKKQYIKDFKKPITKGPAILVSRGYGNSYRFSFVKVGDIEFYGENHINVIYPTSDEAKKYIDNIETSFKNEKTEKFIKYFVGNGALSKTELETVLPIFLD